MKTIPKDVKTSHVASAITTLLCAASLAGCGSNSDSDNPPPDQLASQTTLSCDDSIKTGFKPDADTTVLLVKAFKKGDAFPNQTLENLGNPNAEMAAKADLCLVKLLVGPGKPGPVGAPSTSAGIGIEIWLPLKEKWNGRVHAIGGGGWVGSEETDVTKISSFTAGSAGSAPTIAAEEGAVASSTDTGHTGGADSIVLGGSFAMNPDGTINTRLWEDFAERSIHQQIVKTKALATAYYGSAPKYTYWDGASKGGQQALKVAQRYPEDVDGIAVGNPAINWSKFITADLYPQIVIQRDLGGNYMSADQLNLVSNAAISACDVVGGSILASSSTQRAVATIPRRMRTCSVPPTAGTTTRRLA
nr:tannase/feruloyl esterase family alpha/beta hydrolase [Noviherbaspirillum saxi]